MTNTTTVARVVPQHGAHVATLIELAIAHGLVYVVKHDGSVILVGDRGTLIVNVRTERVRSVRVLCIGDEWRTVPVSSATDIIPVADWIAGR